MKQIGYHGGPAAVMPWIATVKRIAVLGLGLGYSLSVLLAERGFEVLGIDIDPRRVTQPPNPRDVTQMLTPRIEERIKLTSGYDEIHTADVVMVFVATPLVDGRLSTEHVESAIQSTLDGGNQAAPILVLSTLPLGGTKRILNRFPEIGSRYVYVPPWVQQGRFIKTFLRPRYLFYGAYGHHWRKAHELYSVLGVRSDRFWIEDPETVELAKLTANAFFSLKITFANALDSSIWSNPEHPHSHRVLEMMANDKDIASVFFVPGEPFGGPCFPRDVEELRNALNPGPFSELMGFIQELNEKRRNEIDHGGNRLTES